MPVEEGLIVPDFEARDAEPAAILPPGFHDEAPAASAEPTRSRNMFDLQRHFEKGWFSKEYRDAALARTDYVPAMRDMEDMGAAALSGGGSRGGVASQMKTFRGSQRSVLNPLDAIHKRVYDLEIAAANERLRGGARAARGARGPRRRPHRRGDPG